MTHETAGDPMSGLKWTRRTTEKIAAELQSLGISVGPRTVARLLTQLGFSLRVNQKKRSTGSPARRNEQFEQIASLRERFVTDAAPIISVDTKKKELVGHFKNAGVAWNRAPVVVNDHDFRSEAEGIAIPYGIYDLQANRGTMFVGTTYDTPVVRRGRHRAVVAHRRRDALPRVPRTGDPRRWRRKQRRQMPRLEVRAPAQPLRPTWPVDHRRSLPAGSLEVEPDRASTVQRGEQELGWQAARQL